MVPPFDVQTVEAAPIPPPALEATPRLLEAERMRVSDALADGRGILSPAVPGHDVHRWVLGIMTPWLWPNPLAQLWPRESGLPRLVAQLDTATIPALFNRHPLA
jgi:hypothetical protein